MLGMATTQANAFPAFHTSGNRLHQRSSLRPPRKGCRGRLLGGSRDVLQKPTSVADASPASTAKEPEKQETMNWSKQWWPVQFEANLETDRPNRLQLLGRWFVIWKGKSGEWLVMDDVCPHRLAPLSEGRIEDDGNLLCAYHAWRFNEDGKCVAIPQADDEKSKLIACGSLRSRVTKYPCKAYGSLLWVWPDDSPAAIIDAAAAVIPMPGNLASAMEKRAKNNWPTGYTRMLPYSYDVLVENLFDPAHVPVSHHGLFGSSRYTASPLNMQHDEPLDNPHKENTVLAFQYDSISSYGGWAHVEFAKPGCVQYRGGKSRDSEKWIGQYLYAVPIAEGKSRAVVFNAGDSVAHGGVGYMPLPLKLMPWLICHALGTLFDGDSVFLRLQDQQLRKTDEKTGRLGWRNYYMPSSSDRTTAAFRRWLEAEGGGGPPMPTEMQSGSKSWSDDRREVVLDRYSQHSKDCKICQRGLAFFDKIVKVSQVGIAVCIVGALSGGGLANGTAWKWLPGIIVGLSLRGWAKKEEEKFHFMDYVHADHD